MFQSLHTPALNFFFIFVRTRLRYFHWPFNWGSNNKIYQKAKTSDGGFLRNCLVLKSKEKA